MPLLEQQQRSIGNATAFPIMFPSGTYSPLELMPDYLQAIPKALPLNYFSAGLKHVMMYKNPEGLYLNMLIVALLAAALTILGSLITRWKER